jgi:hypothetical protein
MRNETMVNESRRCYEQPQMTVIALEQQMIVCTSIKDYTLEEPDTWAREYVFDSDPEFPNFELPEL